MSSAIVAPKGQESQPTLPGEALNSRVPHALHPTALLDASPLYPAEHSQGPLSAFRTAFVPQAQESELVALVISFSIVAPVGHGVQAILPAEALNALDPHTLHPT